MSRIKISSDENKYFTAHYDSELHMWEQVWHPECEDMEDEEYKAFQLANMDQADKVDDFQVGLYLLDNRNFLFSMSPELQEWHAQNISERLAHYTADANTLRIAIIVSEDFISQLSIEQAMEESTTTEETTKYFENEEEAKEWLLSSVERIQKTQNEKESSNIPKEVQNYAKVELLDNKYVSSHFEPSLNAYEICWKKESKDIQEDEFKKMIQVDLDAILTYGRVDTMFLDLREFTNGISEELQRWYVKTVIVEVFKFNSEVKVAYLVKEDEDMTMIFLQQVVDDVEGLEKATRYFEREQEAREWLMGV